MPLEKALWRVRLAWEERQRLGLADEGGTGSRRKKYSRPQVSASGQTAIFRLKFSPGFGTTDTGHEVSYNVDGSRRHERAAAWPPGRLGAEVVHHRNPSTRGGVPVSTGWQEVQIACRGWSAGHVKSRPSFNCRSSFLSGCLTKQPRAMAPVGRASQSVAKSGSPRFTAWYGRG